MRLPAILRRFSVMIALALAGCASTEFYEADSAPEYQVIKDYTAFYQDGPMQQRGPDLSLRINDRVKLLKKDFTGFAEVEISDGRRGFVGFEDLAPAPPRPREVVEAPSRSSRRGSGASEAAYSGPQFNDISLPDANSPLPNLNVGPEEVPTIPTGPSMIDGESTNEVKPKFRY